MTQSWTVWCGKCQKWDNYSANKKRATEEFERVGWEKTKDGWLCPDCVKKVIDKPTQDGKIGA